MTTWHWVRHGPTHEKAFVGWRDVPADLSDSALIARLDRHLPRDALLISSDLVRATATADAIAGSRKRLAHCRAFREFDFGEWDGLRFSEVAARDPELSRAYWENPGDAAPPGGESWHDGARRVGTAVDVISAANRGAHIVAVAHFGVILTQVQRALGKSPAETLGQKIDNFSVTTLTMTDGAWQAVAINHLP